MLIDGLEEDVLAGKYKDAKIKYLKLSHAAKELTKPLLDPPIFFELPPGLQEDKVKGYLSAREGGNEVGMKRVYQSANPQTKKVIDDLF